jgi:opacity protein-like surface antigen
MKKQWVTGIVSVLCAAGAGLPVYAQERPVAATANGFYGGVSLHAGGTQSAGLNIGPAAAAWGRFMAPTPADDTSSRSLLFGGYRWSNDVAVEAAFNSNDKYALRAPDTTPSSRGVGLTMAPVAAGLADIHSRTWNVDVYTSWAFYRTFALYGRLGVAQADAVPLFTGASLTTSTDPRRLRDGVNYGVGLRYDMNSSLGLRLEYARLGRFSVDSGNLQPDADQLTLGVQYRF